MESDFKLMVETLLLAQRFQALDRLDACPPDPDMKLSLDHQWLSASRGESLPEHSPEQASHLEGLAIRQTLPPCDLTSDLAGIWRTVLAGLQRELSAPSYETWIRPLTLRAIEGADAEMATATPLQVTLGVPSAFHRDWVLRHYRASLIATITQTLADLLPSVGTLSIDMSFELIAQDISQNTGQNFSESADESLIQSASKKPLKAFGDPMAMPRGFEHAIFSELPRGVTHSQPLPTVLNPRYTFEHFVIGATNRFAHAAARAVADHPGHGYNPLFLYGGVGLGKTHLAQAIGHAVLAERPHAVVKYLTAEQFTNDMIDALSRKQMAAFRDRYRKVDVLILEDIQFLEGKERTQEELFHTFNALHQAGKQIVLTSDGHPKRLTSLAERLRSRFEMGLLADVQPIDLETRMAILRQKSRREGLFARLAFSSESLALIAERYPNNIRELEGALNKVAAYTMLHAPSSARDAVVLDISPALVQSALGQTLNTRKLCVTSIIQTVARYYHLEASDLQGPSRLKDVTHARQVSIYLMRTALMLSFQKIGNTLGNRGHSTIMHAFERFKTLLEGDATSASALKRQLEEIQHQLPH